MPSAVIFVLKSWGRHGLAGVQLPELLNQYTHRYAIRNNVMHVEQQQVLLLLQAYQSRAKQRSASEIEREVEIANRFAHILFVLCFGI